MFTFKPPSKNGSNQKKSDDSSSSTSPSLWGGPQKTSTPQGQPHKHIESVLGPGIHYRGTLTGAGGMRIEGTVDGDINIKGPLVIGEGAKITANIHAATVIIGGHVKGNIIATKVEILATGRVWGDLVTTAFASEEGAFLRGQVRMEDHIPAQPEPQAAPAPVLPRTAPFSSPAPVLAPALAAVIEIKPPQLQPEFKRA